MLGLVIEEQKKTIGEICFLPRLNIIDTKLSQVDKTIILLYCDCLSYRKLGKKMNLSHMTIRREVLRIKKLIL